MRNKGDGRVWRLLLAITLCLTCLGCGRKTLPIPPQDAVPLPITDLRYQQDENNVVLIWSYPEQTTAGSDLPGLHSFLVLRAVVPNEEYCSGCPITFSSAVEVESGNAITDVKKREARYTETILRPGHRYFYKVQTKAGWRLVSEDSNTVSFAWAAPVAAPGELIATAGDGKIELRWQPVSTLVDGQPFSSRVNYQVYRSLTSDNFRTVGDQVAEISYTDSGLRNGQTYYYQVRAERELNGTRLVGLASQTAVQTPADFTAPVPPRGLTGVVIDQGIKLLWERNSEHDLAGYRIYRRMPDEKKLTLIGEVGREAMTYVDHLTEASGGCYWAVTSFDTATPANESVFSKELYHESF
ncbi:MAG: fibronectin type III domain-containing protein [Proteobacteria bacterium]|nr:fibronectin type III domain-containing protein [Desulfobulbaceae bacterium]MBU4152776.1 fibronectin type III domain-containing protein [Pseudomonadota bacterium]